MHGTEVCCEFLIFSLSLSLSLFPPDLAVSLLCMAFSRDCSRAIKGKQHKPSSFIAICSSYKTISPREESLMNCFHKSLGLSAVFNYSYYQDCFCPRLKTCLCGLDRLLMHWVIKGTIDRWVSNFICTDLFLLGIYLHLTQSANSSVKSILLYFALNTSGIL